jgi:hypothetical protein
MRPAPELLPVLLLAWTFASLLLLLLLLLLRLLLLGKPQRCDCWQTAHETSSPAAAAAAAGGGEAGANAAASSALGRPCEVGVLAHGAGTHCVGLAQVVRVSLWWYGGEQQLWDHPAVAVCACCCA